MIEPLYKGGDVVLLHDTCEEDIGTMAWDYVRHHRRATVVSILSGKNGVMYGLEWSEEFRGGHNCHGNCKERRGQYAAQQHLELENFEASRAVNTVPNIEGYDEDTKERNL
jgi:hypothetical protein